MKYSLNKQYFFVDIISPIGFGWGILCLCKNQEPQKNGSSGIWSDKYIKYEKKPLQILYI